jgi:hypothetical protein
MGLFDWLSGLFSSKSGEENNDSENNREIGDSNDEEVIQNTYEKTETQDHVLSDLKAEEEHGTESNSAEIAAQHDKKET